MLGSNIYQEFKKAYCQGKCDIKIAWNHYEQGLFLSPTKQALK